MFLGKTLFLPRVSLHRDAQLSTGEFNARQACDGLASLPVGVEKLLVTFTLRYLLALCVDLFFVREAKLKCGVSSLQNFIPQRND